MNSNRPSGLLPEGGPLPECYAKTRTAMNSPVQFICSALNSGKTSSQNGTFRHEKLFRLQWDLSASMPCIEQNGTLVPFVAPRNLPLPFHPAVSVKIQLHPQKSNPVAASPTLSHMHFSLLVKAANSNLSNEHEPDERFNKRTLSRQIKLRL